MNVLKEKQTSIPRVPFGILIKLSPKKNNIAIYVYKIVYIYIYIWLWPELGDAPFLRFDRGKMGDQPSTIWLFSPLPGRSPHVVSV